MKQHTASNPVTKFFAVASTAVEVSCNALDSLVAAYFGQPNAKYSCASLQGWATGTTQTMDLTKHRPLDKWDIRAVNMARKGQFLFHHLDVYLNYLVNNGVIPPAKYIVLVA